MDQCHARLPRPRSPRLVPCTPSSHSQDCGRNLYRGGQPYKFRALESHGWEANGSRSHSCICCCYQASLERYFSTFMCIDNLPDTFVGELGIYYEDLYHLVRPLHEVSFASSILRIGLCEVSLARPHCSAKTGSNDLCSCSTIASTPHRV